MPVRSRAIPKPRYNKERVQPLPQSDPGSHDAEPAPDASEPMLYCPACDNKLSQHKCKLVCDRCGYYMSCADYY